MECHKCKHRAEVATGMYAGKSYEETPCGQCELHECSEYTLEFDPERPEKDSGFGVQEKEDWDGMMPVEVLRTVVVSLLELPPALRDVVCWRFSGFKYDEIAKMQGVTMAAAERRHHMAMRQWPALTVLFSCKVAKHVSRKKKDTGSRQ